LKNALEAALRKNMPDHEFIVAQSAFSKPASFYDEFGRRVVIKPRKGKGVLVLSSLNPAAKQVFGNVLKPFLKSGAKTKLKWSSEAL
jgi:phosphoribosylamine-glycine ligase